jgi:hypothetical protein
MAKPRDKASKKETNRVHAYTVRFNETEQELASRAATEKSLEVASWIRMVTIEAARRQLDQT